MKKFLSQIGGRAAPLGILAIILCAAILYQNGLYEISFIARSERYDDDEYLTDTPTTPLFSDGAVENTDAPTVSDSVLESLNSSTNISTDSGEETKKAETTEGGQSSGTESSQEGKYESFNEITHYTSKGYSISYKDYTDSSVLAEISLEAPSTLYSGDKLVVEFTSARKNADAIPYSVKQFSSKAALTVELYMGYVLIDNGNVISMYTSNGTKLTEFSRTYLAPAYTRDLDGNPLFHLIEDGFNVYYRFDKVKNTFVQADYNDETDNRGLYFDYTLDYGISTNGYNRYSEIVNCIVEMTFEEAEAYTEKQTMPPEVTDTQAPDVTDTQAPDTTDTQAPDTTDTQAPDATDTQAPDTTDTQAPDTTDTQAPDTTDTQAPDTTDTQAPDTTDTQAPDTTDTQAPDTTDTQAPDTTDTQAPDTTDTQASDTSGTQAPDSTDTQAISPLFMMAEVPNRNDSSTMALARTPSTEVLVSVDTAAQLLSNPNGSTTIKYFNYTISEDGKSVFVELMERRWAFDRKNYALSDEYKAAPDEKKLSDYFKYYHLYNFSENLCATVDRNSRITYKNTLGEAIVTRTGEYFGKNNRKLLTGYSEPVLKGIDSVGSLYYDRGYVMVRQVDIDFQFRDKISGDYQYLVDSTGQKFATPAGYNLLAYSDGVLLLERNGYYGYYSIEGKWIAQPMFTYARPFAEGLGVIGFSGSKKGIVDREGNIIVPFKYDHISGISSGVFSAYNEDGWKIIAKLNK